MKRSIFLSLFLLTALSLAAQQTKPRVIILATGGTIAGSATGSTQASYTPGVI
ncbi:MAG: L-asparaginase 2, partial [Bacteroidales bacterium]|nr:L-asparaginase 2 [Bacteroidales bacterium]